ncbi:hypothetical protein BGZ94_001007 [Podila epigama]|nr:hypothetical protein BGZ94_001007 [Podila epigama]
MNTASQRRRQSTIIYPTASLDGLTCPGPGLSSGSASALGNLRPPPTSSNRNSFGMWGGSKSAASTPNLGNLSNMSQSNGFAATLSPPSQASAGQESGASVGSSASSFQQRRKRSESIGGIKNFDDKDAPPIPTLPIDKSYSSSSSINIAPPTSSSVERSATTPELPTLSSYGSGIGPLDTVAMSSLTSDINAQMGDHSFISTSRPVSMHPLDVPTTPLSSSAPARPESARLSRDHDLDLELSQSVSNVESWLNNSTLGSSSPDRTIRSSRNPLLRSTSSPGSTTVNTTDGSSVTPLTSAALTNTAASTPITDHSDMSTHQRRDSQSSGSTDDDDEEEEDDDGMPLAPHARGSSRISRLYETGSIHLGNQSQTSLYYSTKSNVSDEADNNAIAVSKRASMAQDVAFNRNSIRFSEYGISSIKDSGTSITLDSVSGEKSGPTPSPDKPLPRRPVSMFISMSTPTSITPSHLEHEDEDKQDEIENDSTPIALISVGSREDLVNDISLRTPESSAHNSPISVHYESDTTHPKSGSGLLGDDLPTNTGNHPSLTRPATICVSPEDAAKISTLTTDTTAETSDLSPAAQREATEALALRTSKRCYREDETFLPKDEISCYMGTPKPFNRLVLYYYMNNFDFSGKRLDFAFRSLCQKLVLKGETQEVDRVLEAFAQRYVDCNPQHLLGTKDVVHAITYSILLLNTDLHIVQQSTKMSRSAFVKNTLQAVQAQVHSSSMDRPSEDLGSTHGLSLGRSTTGELSVTGAGGSGKKRTPSVKSWKSGQSHQSRNSKMGADPKANGGHGNGKYWMNELESLLKDIYTTVKNHQILLPTSYPQTPVTPTSSHFSSQRTSPGSNALLGGSGSSIGSGGFLPRIARQTHSNASNDFGSSDHSRAGGVSSSSSGIGGMPSFGITRRNSNAAANARTKQIRNEAMQRLNAAGALEGGSYLTPGTTSNASHRYSVIGSGMGEGHVLGGAALAPSSMIDRGGSSSSSRFSMMPLSPSSPSHPNSNSSPSQAALRSPTTSTFGTPDNELLEQYHHGRQHNASQARYRMEGIMYRKHLLERNDKKAQHRNWRQLLVVLDQGGLSMFRADGQLGQVFEEQGVLFDEIRLQHTITNILPPPGYSSSRRHVFAIQLHTGAVYLFQTSTAQEAEDWARTCNYWAARTSKEPLAGGVINMDYGWGRSLDMLNQSSMSDSGIAQSNTMTSTTSAYSLTGENSSGSNIAVPPPAVTSASTNTSTNTTSPGSVAEDEESKGLSSSGSTPSFLNFPHTNSNSSTSSSGANGGGVGYSGYGNGGVSGGGRTASIKSSSRGGGSNVPLGDRVLLFEWTAPMPTMSMSQLSEEEQAQSLKKYVSGLESEMEQHQEHRIPMTKLFLPKSHNYAKAFNNWERRSRYLLKEMVKYQIYVEALEQSLEIRRREAKAEADEAAIAAAQAELAEARAQPVVLPTAAASSSSSASSISLSSATATAATAAEATAALRALGSSTEEDDDDKEEGVNHLEVEDEDEDVIDDTVSHQNLENTATVASIAV